MIYFLRTFIILFILNFSSDVNGDRDSFKNIPAGDKGIEIIGTIVNSLTYMSQNVALIKNATTNKTEAKRVGATLSLDAEYLILSIQENFIEVQSQSENLRLYKFGAVPKAPKPKNRPKAPVGITGNHREEGLERNGAEIVMSKDYRENLIKNQLQTVLMQAAAEPQMDANGNILGFALYDIEEGSVFEKAGLVEGDLVKAINGQELDSAQGAVTLLQSLKSVDNIQAVIIRNGQEIPLSLNVK